MKTATRDRTPSTADRCDLCGHQTTGSFADTLSHLRKSHPRYARGLFLRLSAPFVFLASVLLLSLLGAAQPTFLAAFAVTFAMLFFGKQISRSERSSAGARATLPILQLAREGGLAIVLLVPILLLAVLALSRL